MSVIALSVRQYMDWIDVNWIKYWATMEVVRMPKEDTVG